MGSRRFEPDLRRADVAELLGGDAPRTRPLAAEEPALRGLELPVEFGFGWDEADSADERWYPQGIDAGGSLVLVSWALDGQRAARITFADPDAGRYRHVELAEPVRRELRPVPVHAGGLALLGRHVYVADTIRGLRAFSLDDVYADGERYLMPQLGLYRLPLWRILLGRGPRFSFVSGSDGTFTSGEYRRERAARIVDWEAPTEESSALPATGELLTERTHLQGVLRLDERILLASSAGTDNPGSLAVLDHDTAEPRAVHPWGVGCEDLAHDRERGLVLSLTEHPSAGRVVFAVAAAALW